jgi:Zn finger protein HypA/HybF involved in hydrogenase expression
VSDETAPQEQPRHAHLRANVRRRRGLYALILFLAIVTVAVAIVDIAILRKDPPADRYIEYAVYGTLAFLFLWAFLLLFSRRSGAPAAAPTEEALPEEPRDMSRALLQCPDCKAVFQYGAVHFTDAQQTAFSCPVCGVYSQLPDIDAEPVKVVRPEGEFKELQYHCNNCNEDLAVGTFGETPLHLVRFRACPSCGQKGHIERLQAQPPESFGGQADDGFQPA